MSGILLSLKKGYNALFELDEDSNTSTQNALKVLSVTLRIFGSMLFGVGVIFTAKPLLILGTTMLCLSVIHQIIARKFQRKVE